MTNIFLRNAIQSIARLSNGPQAGVGLGSTSPGLTIFVGPTGSASRAGDGARSELDLEMARQEREARREKKNAAIGESWSLAARKMWSAMTPWAAGETADSSEFGAQNEGQGGESRRSPDFSFTKTKGMPSWLDAGNAHHWLLRALDPSEALAAGADENGAAASGDGCLLERGEPPLWSNADGLALNMRSATMPNGSPLGAASLAAGVMGAEIARLGRSQSVGARAWAMWSLLETDDFLDSMQNEGAFSETGTLGGPAARAAAQALREWAKARESARKIEKSFARESMSDIGLGMAWTIDPKADIENLKAMEKGLENLGLAQLFNWGQAERNWREACVRVERDEIAQAIGHSGVEKSQKENACESEEGAGGDAGQGDAERRGGRRL